MVTHGPPPTIRPYRPDDAGEISRLCLKEGWRSWADADVVRRSLGAPGVATFVACDDHHILGAIEILSDGDINWMVAMLVVDDNHRSQGIGTALIRHTFHTLNAQRLDLLTDGDGPTFYRRLPGLEITGFRLFPDPTSTKCSSPPIVR